MCSLPIEVPRCLTLDVTTSKTFELHVFTDASQLAYGAVAYARIISEHDVSCCFLMSKAKVAPTKQLNVPKRELQAAVLGTRLAHFIRKHHTIEFKDTTFWCDSMAVLAWIKNSEKLKVNRQPAAGDISVGKAIQPITFLEVFFLLTLQSFG